MKYQSLISDNQKSLFKLLGWNRTSYAMLSAFMALLGLIGYIWWPLAQDYLNTFDPSLSFWSQFDWLLLGDFLAMTLLIMAHADLKRDIPLGLIGLGGGLVIEGWGTQSTLWSYYTNERPPLWIIPAWAIATLSIDRLYRLLNHTTRRIPDKIFQRLYWLVFGAFLGLMLFFIRLTLSQSMTLAALGLCLFLIFTPVDRRAMLLVFFAGAGLGYFLELWGTTRLCWTYYTLQTPPLFAVLAHGMAAVAFWRIYIVYNSIVRGSS